MWPCLLRFLHVLLGKAISKKQNVDLNFDGKLPMKLVKHAYITKFRQQNILESFLRPGAKVTLIFFNLSMFSREEIMVQLEKQWFLWEGIARNRISLLASDESSCGTSLSMFDHFFGFTGGAPHFMFSKITELFAEGSE